MAGNVTGVEYADHTASAQQLWRKLPVVYHDPFQYGVESSTGDYVMQTSPEKAGPDDEA